MYGCDTKTLAAMPATCREQMKHYKNFDTEDADMIESWIGIFKEKCLGNGRLLLHIFGGKVQDYEPATRVSKKKRSA